MLQTKITALAGIFSQPPKRYFPEQGKNHLPAAEASGSGSQEPQTDASDENHGVSRDFQPAAETSISGAKHRKLTFQTLNSQEPGIRFLTV